MKKIDWTNYLIELVVVFVGITAAFMLNNWREDYKERRLEGKYLTSFYRDVAADSENLQDIIPANEMKRRRVGHFLEKVINRPNWPVDSAVVIIADILTIHYYDPQSGTYESIKNSGSLGILSDYKLREELIDYYEGLQEVSDKERVYRQWLDAFAIPFIYENVDIMNQETRSEIAMRSYRFSNLVAGYLALLSQNLEVYKVYSRKADILRAKLLAQGGSLGESQQHDD